MDPRSSRNESNAHPRRGSSPMSQGKLEQGTLKVIEPAAEKAASDILPFGGPEVSLAVTEVAEVEQRVTKPLADCEIYQEAPE